MKRKMATEKKPATENDEKAVNVCAAVSVGFVCVIVGLPLWWKTTEVYRVSLPYSDMLSLEATKFQYTVDLDVVSFEEGISVEGLASLSKLLMDKLDDRSARGVKSSYRTSVREATAEEQAIQRACKTVAELDERLDARQAGRENHYLAVILPDTETFRLDRPVVGLYRTVYFSQSGTELSEFSDQIVSVVKETVVRETTVYKGYNHAKGTKDLKPDKESMRSVRSNPGYDTTFTLVSPEPETIDVQWDIEEAVNAYLEPLVRKMAPYTTINIKSQVLYFTRLLSNPKRDWRGKRDQFYFTEKELPHMINPLEAKLGSPASNNPELNFLVYVPTPDQYPLYIRDEDGMNIPGNSFLSPQWGGIHIYNIPPPTDTDQLPISPSLEMRRVMEVFLTQIRLLLNLHSQAANDVEYLPVGNVAMTTWELEGWLRTRCVENLATAASTLKSLAKLLGEISNIVINDEIGQEVNDAVEAIRKSQDYLQEGQLQAAFLASRDAIVASEKAFFDQSLLELLYFPEDQKFAIYIPLFLPISFPVIASLWQSYRWYKSLKKAKQE